MPSTHRPTNRLAGSTSPYLLQHQYNPVDWYPWGEEALARARAEDRPIFLSIGYSACHWCHVMERESFENEAVAALLNRYFVPVKVDREERPDLDEIYMAATQLTTGSGGWPMSVFLTPDCRPFLAGTYFPPEDRWGRVGFRSLLERVNELWRTRRRELEEQAQRIADAVQALTGGPDGTATVSEQAWATALRELAQGFDPVYGGFGAAPKFPPSMRLELFLQALRRGPDATAERILSRTLDCMARGGMYDQVGGGFHRYSVDERWLVPHFEKMLYDNALLARLYTLAYEVTGHWYYGRVARETLDYALRELRGPEGAFYSATDADSEGEEGRFFLWTPAEVQSVLGEADAALFCEVYDITPRGNFEGRSIPNLIGRSLDEWAEARGEPVGALDARLGLLRRKLWEHREGREHPLRDDKILAAWNGLMIRALAEGARVFQEEEYADAAEGAAGFILGQMRTGDRLLRAYRAGRAHLNAYLEDYSYLATGLLDLHLATGNPRWRDEALVLLEMLDQHFWDDSAGTYCFVSHDHEPLIARPRGMQDGATPSGASMAALAHLRAVQVTGEERHRERAARILAGGAAQAGTHPAAFPNMLVAMREYLDAYPDGVRLPGADAVSLEPFSSRRHLLPGSRCWFGVRVRVAAGFHVNARRPLQEYLIPTALVMDPPEGLRVVRWSYPEPHTLVGPGGEQLAVYEGEFLLGALLEVEPGATPGTYRLEALVRLQPCNDRECLSPLEARVRTVLEVLPQEQEEAPEQHTAEVAVLGAQPA